MNKTLKAKDIADDINFVHSEIWYFDTGTYVPEDKVKFDKSLNRIKAYNGQLYDKSEWGLGPEDSICAVAGVYAPKISTIREWIKTTNYDSTTNNSISGR